MLYFVRVNVSLIVPRGRGHVCFQGVCVCILLSVSVVTLAVGIFTFTALRCSFLAKKQQRALCHLLFVNIKLED